MNVALEAQLVGVVRATHEAKAARQKTCWPELTVLPWPEGHRA